MFHITQVAYIVVGIRYLFFDGHIQFVTHNPWIYRVKIALFCENIRIYYVKSAKTASLQLLRVGATAFVLFFFEVIPLCLHLGIALQLGVAL